MTKIHLIINLHFASCAFICVIRMRNLLFVTFVYYYNYDNKLKYIEMQVNNDTMILLIWIISGENNQRNINYL